MWKIVAMWALSAGMLAVVPPRVAMVGMPESDPQIRNVAETYRRGVLAGDARAVSATYEDRAVEMPPGRPALEGRAAIQSYYEGLFRSSARITAFEIVPRETTVAGSIAYDVGTFRQTVSGQGPEPVDMTGSYLVVLKKSGSGWRTAYAIYNVTSPSRSKGSAASPHR